MSKNNFSKWWDDTKTTLKNTVDHEKMITDYNSKHTRYDVYPDNGNNSVFDSFSIYGEEKEGKLTYLSDKEIEINSIIINEKTNVAYYASSASSKTEIKIPYNEKVYIEKGFYVELNDEVEEIKVIKAGNRYFLSKKK